MVDTIPTVCMYSYLSGSFGILCLSAFHMRSILGRTCKIPFFFNVLPSDFQDGLSDVWNIPDDGRRSLRRLG